MTSYVGLANRILDAALARQDIHVLYATPPARRVPTPPAELDRVEQELGFPLPSPLRDFYLGASHHHLVWEEGPPGEQCKVAPNSSSDVCNTMGGFWQEHLRPLRDDSRRGGIICIPEVSQLFREGYQDEGIVPETEGDNIKLDQQTISDAALYENLYPFDWLSYYYIAGLWRNPASGEWRVVLGGDYGACWTDYRTVSLEEYFAQLEQGLGGPHTFGGREIWPLRAE